MFGDIMQPTHILLVLVVALLVLGPKRLPETASKLGSGLRDFRSALSGEALSGSQPEQPTRPTPEYVHAAPEEPLFKAPVESEPEPAPIELSPIDATVVPESRPQARTSDPLA